MTVSQYLLDARRHCRHYIRKMRQVSDPEWVRHNPPRHPEWIGRFPGAQTLASVFPS